MLRSDIRHFFNKNRLYVSWLLFKNKIIDTVCPPLGKWLDRGINGDTNCKSQSVETECKSSPIAAKEETLTDFSKPITEGKQVEFFFDKFIPKNGITLLPQQKVLVRVVYVCRLHRTWHT